MEYYRNHNFCGLKLSSEGIESFQYQKHFFRFFQGLFNLGHFVATHTQLVFVKQDSGQMMKYNNTYLVVSRHKQKKIRNTIIEAAITIASFFLVPCGTLLGNSSSYESQIIATVVYLTIHYSCNNRLSLESWVQCFKSEWSFSKKYVQFLTFDY